MSEPKVLLAPDPPAWSPAQAWAYALGAPYHVVRSFPVNALPQRQSSLLQSMAAGLKRDWGIESAQDLVRTLNGLSAGGHRRPFGISVRQYALLRRPEIAAQREELREAGQENPAALEELWRLDAVQANTDGVRGAVLLGFDAARAVMLARDGWLFEWLPEPTMWDFVLDVARDVQRRFTSWAEYAQDFRVSRNLWAGSNARNAYDPILERLLADARSPWRTLPWQVPGLEIPRPLRPADSQTPVWLLERWDS